MFISITTGRQELSLIEHWRYALWIPMAIMSSVFLIAGISSSFLPETLNENLPQNTEDSLKFGRNKSYFSLAKPLISNFEETLIKQSVGDQ